MNASRSGLRLTDLLLQGGGFSVIVLDMGAGTPEFSSRVPLATWFRYRATAERTQSGTILLSRRPLCQEQRETRLSSRFGGILS